jgi:uncharacterized protein
VVDDLSHLAQSGAVLELRVTPKAAGNTVALSHDGRIRVTVTAVPADGKANAAVIKLMSKALKWPKSRLAITRGAKGRDKWLKLL